jgi:uncharacterized membrane protein YqjE
MRPRARRRATEPHRAHTSQCRPCPWPRGGPCDAGTPGASPSRVGTAIQVTDQESSGDSGSKIGDLLHRITDDVKTIARNEVELAKKEMSRTAQRIVIDTAVILFGAIVALIGLGLLSMVAVVVLEGAIPPLWLRLLIMSAIYIGAGVAIAMSFIKRIKTDVSPNLAMPVREAQQTVDAMQEGLRG